MIKLLYKPVDLIASMVGGLLAGLIFKRVWKLIGHGDAPSPPMSSGAGGKSCWPRCCRAPSSRWSRPPLTAAPPRGRAGSPGSGPATKASSPTSRSDHHHARAESEKARRRGYPEAPRVTLRRAAGTAAAGAASEQEFFARRTGPGYWSASGSAPATPARSPDTPSRWLATPRAQGGPLWFGGGKLAADLTLPKLRCRWGPRPHLRPPKGFTAAERNAIGSTPPAPPTSRLRSHPLYLARMIPLRGRRRLGYRDTLHAAAAALGSRVLRQAADSFDRAALAPHGRVPAVVSPDGISLRWSARLLASGRLRRATRGPGPR